MKHCNLVCVASAALLAGCGTVVTSMPPTPGAQGLVYALPKGQVQVKAQRKRVEAEELAAARKRLADAEAAATASAAKAKEREAAHAQVRLEADAAIQAAAQPNAPDAMVAVKVAKEREVALAGLLMRLAKDEAEARKQAFEQRQREVALLTGQVGQWVETVTVSVLPPVPDVAHRYVLQHAESLARDDKLKFEVANGLLSSSRADSTGQVSTVLLNAARAVGAAAAPGEKALLQMAPLLAKPGDGPMPGTCVPYDLEVRFDPTHLVEVLRAHEALSAQGLTLRTDPLPERHPLSSPAVPGYRSDRSAAGNLDGVMYRAQVPVHVEVSPQAGHAARSSCNLGAAAANARVSGLFPDVGTRFALPIVGAAFAKVSTTYAFKDGMPVSAEIDRPSQLVAITALPVDILKAILGVPAELIKLRVDYSSQAAAQAEAQVREAKAQQALIEALQDLEAARRAAAP